jgi:hypothetical protein
MAGDGASAAPTRPDRDYAATVLRRFAEPPLFGARDGRFYETPLNGPENSAMILQRVWQRLAAVRQLTFRAVSAAAITTGWKGAGEGSVAVVAVSETVLIFREQGRWQPAQGPTLPFRNVYRWTLDAERACLGLEHLRFGEGQPVFLFDLVAHGDMLVSASPHLCREDEYAAHLCLEPGQLRLDWRVTGPHKNERIQYCYR